NTRSISYRRPLFSPRTSIIPSTSGVVTKGCQQAMATPRRRRLSAERRRALQLLAGSESGMTEVLLLAGGGQPHMLDRLLRSGLATIQHETVKAGDQPIEIGRVMITDAGRRLLEHRG